VTLSWCQIQLVVMTAMHADSLFCITMALGNALLSARWGTPASRPAISNAHP